MTVLAWLGWGVAVIFAVIAERLWAQNDSLKAKNAELTSQIQPRAGDGRFVKRK